MALLEADLLWKNVLKWTCSVYLEHPLQVDVSVDMEAKMAHQQVYHAPNISPEHAAYPEVLVALPTGESDFLPEIRGERRANSLIMLFGETMSKKNSNTADAQQTRGQKGSLES